MEKTWILAKTSRLTTTSHRTTCEVSMKYNMSLHQVIAGKYECWNLVHCCYILALVFTCYRLTKGRVMFFSTQINCWEFLAFNDVILQSDHHSYFKNISLCNSTVVLPYIVELCLRLVKAIKLEGQKTVTANLYIIKYLSEILQEVNLRGLMLHHDNASSHMARLTIKFLEQKHISDWTSTLFLKSCYVWLMATF